MIRESIPLSFGRADEEPKDCRNCKHNSHFLIRDDMTSRTRRRLTRMRNYAPVILAALAGGALALALFMFGGRGWQ